MDLSSFADFHSIVSGIEANRHIFRGVKDAENHRLIPSLKRLTLRQRGNSGVPSYERRIFTQFKQSAIPFLSNPPNSDLDWLALAQHHGLPTRLLDWSYNPLVALFFAVEGESDADSAVYMYRARDKTVRSNEDVNPFVMDEIAMFSPDHAAERIIAQKGLFAVHPNPREELHDEDRMNRLTIPVSLRVELRYALRRYNVNPARMFPGLDGLAGYILES